VNHQVPFVARGFFSRLLVALPIVAALPVAAPAMPSTEIDAVLVQAALAMRAADRGISDLHDKFGDDADSREDYSSLEDRRNENIATLVTVPAKSIAGIQAKAVCVRLRTLIEDYDQHQQVAVSLADDLVQSRRPCWQPSQNRRLQIAAPRSKRLSVCGALNSHLSAPTTSST
jgi:hypothetical protein